jgi:multiple sugar transport system permease protein
MAKVFRPRLSASTAPYVLLLPFIVLFLVFGLFPMLFSLYLSFQVWEPTSGLDTMRFVGLDNYVFALNDDWFWKSLRNTAWLAIASGVPQHLVAIPLAHLVHTAFRRSRNGVVGAYFVPYITSSVAIAILFGSLYSTDYGLINAVLGYVRAIPWLGTLLPAEAIDWLNDPDTLKPAVAALVFWRYVGFNLVLYLAAMQSIPADLYEAAEMDGATEFKKFWYITLPSLKPMALFAVTLSVIGGLQLFEEPFILTLEGRGGTDQAAMTSAIYFYRMAFDFSDFGGASAMSWLLCVVIAALTWGVHRILGEKQS